MIIQALEALGFEYAFIERREQEGSQDGDDRDHYKQFNQREAAKPGAAVVRQAAWNWYCLRHYCTTIARLPGPFKQNCESGGAADGVES